ncbi:biotin/lipoyl-binding protein [Paenibacillus sp. P96]|uniref:Biotin/lipoyl-binding protein n=1 Tax=Paenibacillus zeirhizosphaerae TaxID=2987519 RepID=A0ABT9FM79_9BACL|nr:biotin/lipoyl-binding protein [Paenibacillus sp. P96]MDP4095851.1 biotin/lipoyl-binding protein [Paenibacillus sp. P96]
MLKKVIPYLLLVIALGTGGILMAMSGKDAVSMAAREKDTLLAADTVNASFQGVGGKVSSINVKEEQQVKKGDVLMTLDPVDKDLEIEKLKSQIAQMDVQIAQAKDSLDIQADKITESEKQAQLDIQAAQTAESKVKKGARAEDIQQQQLAIASAKQSAENALTAVETAKQNVGIAKKAVTTRQKALELARENYTRIKALKDSGISTQAELDKAQNDLDSAEIAFETAQDQVDIAKQSVITASNQADIARNAVAQQQTALEKMLAGATAEEREQARVQTEKAKEALTQTSQSREEVENGEYNVNLLTKQKEALQVQLKALQLQRDRTVLKSPVDGKVTRVVPKLGENVSAGATVIMIETDDLYYDLYVGEEAVAKFLAGSKVNSRIVALNRDVEGEVEYVTSAPQYTNMRMSRDKGQSDISSFQVRVRVPRTEGLLPGMTVEVQTDESTD